MRAYAEPSQVCQFPALEACGPAINAGYDVVGNFRERRQHALDVWKQVDAPATIPKGFKNGFIDQALSDEILDGNEVVVPFSGQHQSETGVGLGITGQRVPVPGEAVEIFLELGFLVNEAAKHIGLECVENDYDYIVFG